MIAVLVRSLAALCLSALLIIGCGGGADPDSPEVRATPSDPATVPTALADESRPPYRIQQDSVSPPGAEVEDEAPIIDSGTSTGLRSYVVEEGDTCGGIANQMGVSLAALLEANPRIDEDCTNLQVGEEIRIPASEPGAAPADDGSGTGGSSGLLYVVLSGDTCAGIADAHDVPLADLLEANGLDEEACQTLGLGTELVIPD